MATQEDILKDLYSQIDELNLVLPEGQQLKKEPDQALISFLDSLGLVNFLVHLNDHLEILSHHEIYLMADQILEEGEEHLESLQSFSSYLQNLVSEGE